MTSQLHEIFLEELKSFKRSSENFDKTNFFCVVFLKEDVKKIMELTKHLFDLWTENGKKIGREILSLPKIELFGVKVHESSRFVIDILVKMAFQYYSIIELINVFEIPFELTKEEQKICENIFSQTEIFLKEEETKNRARIFFETEETKNRARIFFETEEQKIKSSLMYKLQHLFE